MIENKNATPLHAKIYADIRDLIIEKQMGPNEKLPSENELCAKYTTTRRTVREALKRLEQEGLIYAQRKRGYFVQRPSLDTFTIDNSDLVRESTSHLKDIRIITPDSEIQEKLNIDSRHMVVAITRLNLCQDVLYGVELKYIPYDKGYPSIESEIRYAVFPDPANEKTYAFSYHANVSIQAVSPPANVAELLHCGKEEPLLLIKRLYVTHEGAIIGYSKQYLLQSHGQLHGVSGYVQNR